MKKSLIALATLAAVGTAAHAASVTLYGTVDTGLAYNYNKSVDAMETPSRITPTGWNLGS